MKPEKPYPEFPLFPHATKRWAKKIRGKMHYFGPWADWEGALAKYEAQKDALHAGRTPRADVSGNTVKDMVDAFLVAKRAALNNREITHRTYEVYEAACTRIVEHFRKRLLADIGIADFAALRSKLAKRWGLKTLGNAITNIRVVFKFAFDNNLIDRPVAYGSAFKAPSKKTMRLDRAKKGTKLFAKEEIRQLISGATVQMKAMILLGINCGFGNSDCGNLPLSAVDLERGWIDYPRPKTGIPRQAPLWPETVEAIKEVLSCREKPAITEYVFLTHCGSPWAKEKNENPIAKEMMKLLKKLHINGRVGLGFYTLRHTFRTVADESKDQPAVDFIMGHEIPHMSVVYRESISEARLRAVTDYVRAWLFAL